MSWAARAPRARGSSALDTPSEPSQHLLDAGQAVPGDGGPGSDPDRDPAVPINHGEAFLVAAVVADEYRGATAERKLRHEGLDRSPFSAGSGQQLDDHFAVDRFE